MPRTHDGAQIVLTSPDFRAGQKAAWADFDKDNDMTPNTILLSRLHSTEFALGYMDEYRNFIVPVQNGAPRAAR